jgi:5-methylthioribose kinase
MHLTPENAGAYLRSRHRIRPDDAVAIQLLTGGVSNTVLRVSGCRSGDLVVKQALGRLAVNQPWYCSVERIWQEVKVLSVCQRLLSSEPACDQIRFEIPETLFEDRELHLYAMTAAPVDHVVWKRELMEGRARLQIAAACGSALGRLHTKSWHDATIASQLDDRSYFHDLRLDPFYRHVACQHCDLRPAIDKLIESVLAERHSLVHGDFSPKNLLLYGDCLMLIDFEVGHYGDPAFDLGFFLTHLMLKGFHHAPGGEPYFDLTVAFWNAYGDQMTSRLSPVEFERLKQRAFLNFAGCALARLDGKSPVDYLPGEERRQQIRRFCRTIFEQGVDSWDDVLALARRAIDQIPVSANDHASHGTTRADH